MTNSFAGQGARTKAAAAEEAARGLPQSKEAAVGRVVVLGPFLGFVRLKGGGARGHPRGKMPPEMGGFQRSLINSYCGPTSNGFLWFQSGAGFRPPTVGPPVERLD